MGQSTEWIEEDALATALSVDRSVLRGKRPYLLAGEVQQKNAAVQWQLAAAQRVAGELGIPLVLETQEKTPGAHDRAPDDDVETLTVIGQAVNRNIVNAQRANGDRVAVRVVDNHKYVPKCGNGRPMTLRAKRSTSGNWWILVGREPRWTGVW